MAFLAMLQVSVADRALSAIQAVTRTAEVHHDLDLELFELGLLDSLGVVELMVLFADDLGLQLSLAESC